MSKETYLYLGKSNSAPLALINSLRHKLGKTPFKEHREHEVYDENKLINASYCIMLLGSNILGKGVFEQITRLKQYKIPFKILFPYTPSNGIASIYVMDSDFTLRKTTNDNDYINWGKIQEWGNYTKFPFTDEGFNDALKCIRLGNDYQKFMSKVGFEEAVDLDLVDNTGQLVSIKIKENPKVPSECFVKDYNILLLRRKS